MLSTKMVLMTLLILGSFLCTATAEEKGIVKMMLTTDGKPNATIVVAENPTPSANLAALEVQYHIKKITGAVLPIKSDSPAQ